MYLKQLVLKGFKSFAVRSALTFEPGLTAIVGPNGSGKSNISDAVLWVLGEQSPKHLRGQAMEDVIFAGSSARKPVSLAEVQLVLDNSDRKLPVEFDEVAITRRIYRSGESEYLINGSPCRLMDVRDILHDTGLGRDAHTIISQGTLDAVVVLDASLRGRQVGHVTLELGNAEVGLAVVVILCHHCCRHEHHCQQEEQCLNMLCHSFHWDCWAARSRPR